MHTAQLANTPEFHELNGPKKKTNIFLYSQFPVAVAELIICDSFEFRSIFEYSTTIYSLHADEFDFYISLFVFILFFLFVDKLGGNRGFNG